jgi:hypothetical protein
LKKKMDFDKFLLVCHQSIGFEVRTALDFTDHVWAEIWSECQQRWVHCDPCENCFDGPLMYEGGWGKKLTYVIAASADECVDVTRRYTAKFEAEVLGRRTLCGEGALKSIIQRTNENCLQRVARTATAARLDEIKDRQVREQQELTNGLNRDEKRELQPHERIGRVCLHFQCFGLCFFTVLISSCDRSLVLSTGASLAVNWALAPLLQLPSLEVFLLPLHQCRPMNPSQLLHRSDRLVRKVRRPMF